jgi:hypothetical protein
MPFKCKKKYKTHFFSTTFLFVSCNAKKIKVKKKLSERGKLANASKKAEPKIGAL